MATRSIPIRMVTGLIVAVATISLLAQCRFPVGISPPPADQTPAPQPQPTLRATLTPPTYESGFTGVTITFVCSEAGRDEYEKLAAEFHQLNPDILVQIVSSTEVLQLNAFKPTKREDNLYHIISAVDTATTSWLSPTSTRQGLVQDLTSFIEADTDFRPDDFYPSALENFQWDGGTWALPSGIQPDLIFYDREAFDQMGVAHPRPGWTWEDFVAMAQKLTVREGDTVVRYGFVDNFMSALPGLIAAQAGPLVDDATQPPTPRLDDPAVIKAVEQYVALPQTYRAMPNFTEHGAGFQGWGKEPGSGFLWMASLIEEKQSAMWPDALFSRRRWEQTFHRLGVAPYPAGVMDATPLGASGHLMSAGTQHPQESWRWLVFLTRYRTPPDIMKDNIPARRSVAAETGYWDSLDAETAAVYRYALEHPLVLRSPMWWEIAVALQKATEAILAGEKTTQEALAEAQAEVMQQRAALMEITPQPVVIVTPGAKITATLTLSTPVAVLQEDTLRHIAEGINVERQMDHVRFLASDELRGRAAGSPEEDLAGDYIVQHFTTLGLKPFSALGLEGYIHSFPILKRATGEEIFHGENVIGLIPGSAQPESYVIIGAHYDGRGVDEQGCIYNGADDDASGVSAILETAQVFSELDLRPEESIVFVVFSGEEVGLQGSRPLRDLLAEKELSDRVLLLNVEVIGAAKGDWLDIWEADLDVNEATVAALDQAASLLGVETVHHGRSPGSDAHSFLEGGISALSISWAWSPENHPYYETPDDDVEHIYVPGVEMATKVAAGAVWILANDGR